MRFSKSYIRRVLSVSTLYTVSKLAGNVTEESEVTDIIEGLINLRDSNAFVA